MANYTIPGVYIEEIPKFPPSVAQVETAIPAFIGYTEKRLDTSGNALATAVPVRIKSLTEFETRFGKAPRATVAQVRIDANNIFLGADVTISHYLYDSVRLFYSNGGGDCYVVSVGAAYATPIQGDIDAGISALEKVDEPTIMLFPDAVLIAAAAGLYNSQKNALAQCELLKDRVVLCDLKSADPLGVAFRSSIGINSLKYGMAYTPWLRVALPKNVTYRDINTAIIVKAGAAAATIKSLATAEIQTKITTYETAIADVATTAAQLEVLERDLIDSYALYKTVVSGINDSPTTIPPSGAVAGVYAFVDRTRGVWKAPANVSLNEVIEPVNTFAESELSALNVDVNAGKSINAIRTFTGKGVLVWGARTLAGNDNEWRYVPVRRFYNMVEESVKKACEQFVFEPNDANTWVRVRAMIENFLTLQWRDGALQGAKAEHAFFVEVGLGRTMTAQDILEGRMIVEIGMAPVRPAEFIILRFSQKMAES